MARRPWSALNPDRGWRTGAAPPPAGRAYHEVVVIHDGEASPDAIEQFSPPQQEVGIGRPAIAFVADGESLIDEHAPRRQRLDEHRQQGSMQVVGDDDPGERPAGVRPGAAFDVGTQGRDPRNAGEARERGRIAIHRMNLVAARREHPGMPAATACNIKHCASRRDEIAASARPRWKEPRAEREPQPCSRNHYRRRERRPRWCHRLE